MKGLLLFLAFSSTLLASDDARPPAVSAKATAKTTPKSGAKGTAKTTPGSGAKATAKATPGRNAKPAAAKNDLIGTWYGIRAEYDGEQPVNNDLVRSSYAIIEADRIFVFIEGKRYGPAFYRLNQSVKPHQIDVWGTTPEGEFLEAQAIYRLQDDKLWVCVRAKKDRRPTSFMTWAGSKAGLAIGQRRSR
jgi:uncharacterized protein (TIGR03067 family)